MGNISSPSPPISKVHLFLDKQHKLWSHPVIVSGSSSQQNGPHWDVLIDFSVVGTAVKLGCIDVASDGDFHSGGSNLLWVPRVMDRYP